MFRSMFSLIIFSVISVNAYAAGALAIDGNQGKSYGFAYGYSSASEASNRALSECGRGCSVVKVFSGGCAAYAADQSSGSTVYGWATGPNVSHVKSSALQYCRSQGGSQCIVRVWACE